mmetsp:Transcript_5504/g.15327  ORF Transcript_5504/g.15327 Transcript_5504/m.15327 type:complete len:416 (-) Transcript_5504:787-2034(-)
MTPCQVRSPLTYTCISLTPFFKSCMFRLLKFQTSSCAAGSLPAAVRRTTSSPGASDDGRGSRDCHMCNSLVVRERPDTMRPTEAAVPPPPSPASSPRKITPSGGTVIRKPLASNSSTSVRPTSTPPPWVLRMRSTTSCAQPAGSSSRVDGRGTASLPGGEIPAGPEPTLSREPPPPGRREENIAETSMAPAASAFSSLSRTCWRTRCFEGSRRARRLVIFFMAIDVGVSGLLLSLDTVLVSSLLVAEPAAVLRGARPRGFAAEVAAMGFFFCGDSEDGMGASVLLVAGALSREDGFANAWFSFDRAANTPSRSSWLSLSAGSLRRTGSPEMGRAPREETVAAAAAEEEAAAEGPSTALSDCLKPEIGREEGSTRRCLEGASEAITRSSPELVLLYFGDSSSSEAMSSMNSSSTML